MADIHPEDAAMTAQIPLTDAIGQLMADLLPHIAVMDVDALLQLYPTVDAIAARMIAAIPALSIHEPDIGACYTSRRLAVLRNVSRQAVFQQHRDGRIIGFKHRGVLVYPDVQFGPAGSLLPETKSIGALPKRGSSATEVFEWLQLPWDESEKSRREILAAAQERAYSQRSQIPGAGSLQMDPRGQPHLRRRSPRG